MRQIWQLIVAHPTSFALGAYWLFSNMVSALPSPMSQTSFYRFFFNFMHLTAGTISRAYPALRIPGPNQPDMPSGQTSDTVGK